MNVNRILSLLFAAAACGAPSSPAQVGDSGAAAAPSTSPAETKNEVVVRPGAIGPIALGMRREDVERLGLSVRPHPSGQMGDNVRMVGPYYVVFTAGRVHSVELTPRENRASLRIGQRVFPPNATGDELATALPGCGPWDSLEGGRMRRCDGGKMLLKLGASCAARAPNGDCDRWDPAHPDLAVQAIEN